MEWGPDGIRAVLVIPAAESDQLAAFREPDVQKFAEMLERVPVGRFGDAEADIGRPIASADREEIPAMPRFARGEVDAAFAHNGETGCVKEDFWDLHGARTTAAAYAATCSRVGAESAESTEARLTRGYWPTGAPDWARTSQKPQPSWLEQPDLVPLTRPSQLDALLAERLGVTR